MTPTRPIIRKIIIAAILVLAAASVFWAYLMCTFCGVVLYDSNVEVFHDVLSETQVTAITHSAKSWVFAAVAPLATANVVLAALVLLKSRRNKPRSGKNGIGTSPASGIRLLCDVCNSPVVWMPDRGYPGVVLQGDSLHNLYELICGISKASKDGETVFDLAEQARYDLQKYLLAYQEVLRRDGIDLPYSNEVQPDPEVEWDEDEPHRSPQC